MRDYLLSYKVSPYKLARRGEHEKSQWNFPLGEKERNKKDVRREWAYEGPKGKRGNLSGGGERVKAKDVMKPPLIQNCNWIEWLAFALCLVRLKQKIMLVCTSFQQLFKLPRRRGEIITKCSHCGAVWKNAYPLTSFFTRRPPRLETIRFRLRIVSFAHTHISTYTAATAATLLLWSSCTILMFV